MLRDSQEAVSHLVQTHVLPGLLVNLVGKFLNDLLAGLVIQTLILVFTKNLREEVRQETAEEQVGISYGSGAAFPIAGRPWVSADRFGSDNKETVLEE